MALASPCLLLSVGLVCSLALQMQEVEVPVKQTRMCAGVRTKFDAGFGGCEVYGANRNLHKFCTRDLDPQQGYYASQVCDECKQCSGDENSLHRAVRTGAYGDPHMQNIFGQKFDLMQPGDHTLVQIPRGSPQDSALLRVAAGVSRVGASCSDMYIMKLNVTGQWVEQAGEGMLHFEAGAAHSDEDIKWFHFGEVGLKVAYGKTSDGTPYLNFFVRNLKYAGHHVGGLLGEDSHEVEATPSANCRQSVSLMSVGKLEPRSVAVAEEGM